MVQGMNWPDADTAQQLHGQLGTDDPVATSRFAEAFLDPLADWLRRSNPQVDPHLCDTAAIDLIISMLKRPEQYNPTRGPLDHYLRMAAQGDLRNLLEKEQRHAKRRADLSPVELLGGDRNVQYKEDFDDVESFYVGPSELLKVVQEYVWRTFSLEEQRALQLLLDGERKTIAFAEALGIAHLTELEQRREVKQAKDRIKKRLQRARSQS
jgi:hypothetical protein